MAGSFHTFGDQFTIKSANNVVLANSTQNGTGVDTQGYRRAAAVISVFTGSATTANFVLQDSPDNSAWTNVTGGTLASAIVASTATSDYVINIDLAKRARYLRVNAVGTGTAGNFSAIFILGEPMTGGVASLQEQTVITV